jgi:hypothetical protein
MEFTIPGTHGAGDDTYSTSDWYRKKKYYFILFLNGCKAVQKNKERRGPVNLGVRQNLYNKKNVY